MAKKITERTERTLDGNAACAEALRQINPDVFGFYPITPTSYIGEKFSKFVADGEVETEYVCAESEHAAMSVCVGAAAAGSRAATATASQGLLLMTEVLYNASGLRLPIVMVNGNRSLGAPLSIHCDHGDAMSVRDSGWIQIFAENAQEAYDFMLMAPLIAEDLEVRTPIMVCMDCFQTTHTMMNVALQTDEEVQSFVGEATLLDPLLDVDNPASYGNFDKPNFYMEHRRAQLQGLLNAKEKIPQVFGDFAEQFSRGSSDMVDCYQTDDADFVFIVMASTSGTIRRTVDHLREKGVKAGMARIKVFRPFPAEEIKAAISGSKNVLVLDRMSPAGANFGAVGAEISSLFAGDSDAPEIKNAVYGLGSRETTYLDFAETLENFADLPSDHATWINLRED